MTAPAALWAVLWPGGGVFETTRDLEWAERCAEEAEREYEEPMQLVRFVPAPALVYVVETRKYESVELLGTFTELRAAIRAARVHGEDCYCYVFEFQADRTVSHKMIADANDGHEVWSGPTWAHGSYEFDTEDDRVEAVVKCQAALARQLNRLGRTAKPQG